MENHNEMSDEELIAARNKLLQRQKNLSGLSNEQLVAQYRQLGGTAAPKEQLKPLWQRAVSAEAQGLGNVIQNIGKTTGLISKEAEPWKIRQALGVTSEPTGYEKFVTGATENVLPFALPALRVAKGAGALANIINRGTLPALYYKLQGKNIPQSLAEGYGGAALPEVAAPILKAGISAGKQIAKPIIKGVKEGYTSVKNLPAYQQELENISNAGKNLTNELLPSKFSPEEGRTLTHEENIFRMTAQKLKEMQKELGGKYEKFKEKHLGQEVETGIQKTAQQIIDELPEPSSLELFGVNSKSAEELGHEINAQIVPVNKNVNTIFDNYRSMRKYAQRALNKAFAKDSGLSPDEVNELKFIAKGYNTQADKLEKLLEDAKYGESLNELKNINKDYAEKYAPIYRTNIYWNMLNSGKVPEDFLKQITGLTEGRKIFRNIVKNNPELRKAAIGQHAKTSEGLVADDVVLEPYLKAEQDLAQRTKSYKEALKNKPQLEKKAAKGVALKKAAISTGLGLAGFAGAGKAFKIGSQ